MYQKESYSMNDIINSLNSSLNTLEQDVLSDYENEYNNFQDNYYFNVQPELQQQMYNFDYNQGFMNNYYSEQQLNYNQQPYDQSQFGYTENHINNEFTNPNQPSNSKIITDDNDIKRKYVSIGNEDEYKVVRFEDVALYQFGDGMRCIKFQDDINSYYYINRNGTILGKAGDPINMDNSNNLEYRSENHKKLFEFINLPIVIENLNNNDCSLIYHKNGKTYIEYKSKPGNYYLLQDQDESIDNSRQSTCNQQTNNNNSFYFQENINNQTYQNNFNNNQQMINNHMSQDNGFNVYNYYQTQFNDFYNNIQQPMYNHQQSQMNEYQQYQPICYDIYGNPCDPNEYITYGEPITEGSCSYNNSYEQQSNVDISQDKQYYTPEDIMKDLEEKFTLKEDLSNIIYFGDESELIGDLPENFDIVDHTSEIFMRRQCDPQVSPCPEFYFKPRLPQEEIERHRLYRRANHYIDNQVRERYTNIRDRYFKQYGLYDVGLVPVDIDYILYGGVESANVYGAQTIHGLYNQNDNSRMSALGYGINPSVHNNGMNQDFVTNIPPVNKFGKDDYKQGSVTQTVFRTHYGVSNDYESERNNSSLLSGYVNNFSDNGSYTSQPLNGNYRQFNSPQGNRQVNYNGYQYNEDLPHESYNNQMFLLNMVANKVSGGKIKFEQTRNQQRVEDSEEFKEMEKLYTERYKKYGVTDIDDIRYLVEIHGITEDELWGPRHRELLARLKQYEEVILDQSVREEIETLYIPKLKEMYYNASYNYYTSPERHYDKTIEDLENYLIIEAVKRTNEYSKQHMNNHIENYYKKFRKSKQFNETFEIGRDIDILTSYGSPLAGTLAEYAENRTKMNDKVQELIERHNNDVDNPVKIGINADGSLNVSMLPEFKEAKKARELARKRAKELGREYHQ